jgi:dihydropyrimidine dehydrogenase (NAD+) subunit PreA
MLACPVDNCITMERVDAGTEYLNWTQHPNNPMAQPAAAGTPETVDAAE